MAAQEVTIADGVITVTGDYVIVSGEGNTNDTLEMILGGTAGQVLVLRPSPSGGVITVPGGSGKIYSNSNTGRTLSAVHRDAMTLICIGDFGEGSIWEELAYSRNHSGDA